MTTTAAPTQSGLPDIAFIGKAGAGKSTAAELLFMLNYRRLSFAQPLKDLAAQLWGEEARNDRSKLQKLGVGAREIDEDVWVNQLLKHYRALACTDVHLRRPVVIDDCRFPNEYWALKAEGFAIVRITAPRSLRIYRLKQNGKWQSDEQLDHESEIALDGYDADYTIENDDDTFELYDSLSTIVLKERRRR